VLVNGERYAEPNETFIVNLSSPTNATIADGQGVDQDAGAVLIGRRQEHRQRIEDDQIQPALGLQGEEVGVEPLQLREGRPSGEWPRQHADFLAQLMAAAALGPQVAQLLGND
jgi:hypothetical protein